jgi:hypothetical protein
MTSDKYKIASVTFLFIDKNDEQVYRTVDNTGLTVEIPEVLASAYMTEEVQGHDVPLYRIYSGVQEISSEWPDDEVDQFKGLIRNHLIIKCLDEYAKKKFANSDEKFVCTEEYYLDSDML